MKRKQSTLCNSFWDKFDIGKRILDQILDCQWENWGKRRFVKPDVLRKEIESIFASFSADGESVQIYEPSTRKVVIDYFSNYPDELLEHKYVLIELMGQILRELAEKYVALQQLSVASKINPDSRFLIQPKAVDG